MQTLIQDLRYGARVLLKSPGFSIVAVLALMLGIGANSAIFSVVNTILLKPLAYKDPEQLVAINHSYPKIDLKASVSAPGYMYYREHAQSFSSIAALDGWQVNVTGDAEPERLAGARVSANLFSTLGASASLGRVFAEEENQVGRNRVVVLSDGLWRRRYAADPHILGKSIQLNGESYDVVGVMPSEFQFGREIGRSFDIWSPVAFTPEDLSTDNLTFEHLVVIARLKPQVTLRQAQAELDSIAANLREMYMPGEDATQWTLSMDSLNALVVGDIKPALIVLLAAVCFVLLIACANVANLTLARGAARQKEIAVRTALGANRKRLIRQLLTESILLSLVGGVLGLFLAMWGVDALLRLNGDKIPRAYEIGLDSRVVLFTAAVSILTGIIFGLIPAFQSSRVELNDVLKEGGRGGARVLRQGIRNALVVVEVSMAIILLVGAGLLIRSFIRLQHVSPGFDPRNLLVMQLSLPDFKYHEVQKKGVFYDEMLERIRSLPGVTKAGAISVLPMSGQNQSGSFTIQGKVVPKGELSPHGDRWAASADYFQTMNIALVRGRYFTEHDRVDAPNVAIVDESMARKYWPDQDPIGQRITFDGSDENPNWREIVGIVGHVKHKGLEGESRVQYYIPFDQQPRSDMFLAIRTVGEPSSLAGAVRNTIRGLDTDLPVYRVSTMDTLVAESLTQRRFAMLLLGIFAFVALALAVVGIYGVMSYMVAQRTNEIGIRMALGARVSDVVKLVVGQGMLPVIAGVVLGLAGAFLGARLMASLLFGVTATDPLTFIAVSITLALVAFLACFIPARRAARINPVTAIRYE